MLHCLWSVYAAAAHNLKASGGPKDISKKLGPCMGIIENTYQTGMTTQNDIGRGNTSPLP